MRVTNQERSSIHSNQKDVPAVVVSDCISDWSDNATFVTSLGNTGFANSTAPIWTDSANYAFFHRGYAYAADPQNSDADLVAAIAYVTAVGDTKLLGSYRLFVNGHSRSIGPGRGDQSIAEDGNLVYDTVDVTPTDGAAIDMGLQCYHSDASGAGVMMEVRVKI